MNKNIYFLSDAHLGSLAIEHGRMQERRIVRFLDSIKHKAAAIYLLGDMFDFWNEYRYVVPKGFTRFLGKLSELTDMGVEVHFFTGNHDMWTYGYLEEECGVTVHYKPLTTEIYGKVFYLAHGDGLGDPDNKFKLLRYLFHNRTCQKLLNSIHPRWTMAVGLNWAKHSRIKRADGKAPIELDLMLSRKTRMMIIGDWIWQYTYVVFDGEHIFLEEYVEGESQP